MARQAAAEPDADLAERQVDLVVQDEHVVELELVGATRGAGGTAGLVHERLRLQQRDARAARSGAALGQLAGELLLGLGQIPAARQLVGDLEARVVRRLGVAGARIPEPDYKPVDRSRSEELQDASPEIGSGVRSLVGVALGLRAILAHDGRLDLDVVGLGLDRRGSDRRDHGLLEVVEERDAVRRGDRRQRERVVDLHRGHVVRDRVRDVTRQRLDVDLARLLGEHAALGDARRVVGAERARGPPSCGSSRACSRGGSPRARSHRAPGGAGDP